MSVPRIFSVSEVNKLEQAKLPRIFSIDEVAKLEQPIDTSPSVLGQPKVPTHEETVSQLTFTPPKQEKLKEPQIVSPVGRLAVAPPPGKFDVTEGDIVSVLSKVRPEERKEARQVFQRDVKSRDDLNLLQGKLSEIGKEHGFPLTAGLIEDLLNPLTVPEIAMFNEMFTLGRRLLKKPLTGVLPLKPQRPTAKQRLFSKQEFERKFIEQTESEFIETQADKILPKFNKEAVASNILKELEIDISKTKGKLDLALNQIENVSKTGTFQPKGIRPKLSKGVPAEEESLVSKSVVEEANKFFVNAGNEVRRLRQVAESQADDLTLNQLKVAEGRFKIAFAKRQEAARTASESLSQFRFQVNEAKEILGSLDLIKDIKPKIAVVDRIILAALKRTNPELAERLANGEVVGGLHLEPAPMRIPENLQAAKAMVNYFRVNLFPMFSFMRDAITNSIATAFKLPSYAMRDIYAMGRGYSPNRILGVVKSMKEQGKFLGRFMKDNPLPKEIENALGGEISESVGERFTRLSNIKAGKFPIDYVLSPAIKLKRGTDVLFSRTMTLADLISNGVREADILKLSGLARQKFIDNFIKNPPDSAKASAIELGKKVKFRVDVSKIEEKISRSMGLQLLGDTFPGWSIQFSRWMGRTLGADPAFFKKVKLGQATADDVIQYVGEMATGWGGIGLVNQSLYDSVDFNSMEYVNDKKERTRLSGLTPIPEALLLSALFRGDKEKAALALRYTSIPFSGLMSGEPSGLLANWIEASGAYVKGGISNDRFIREIEFIINRLINHTSNIFSRD